MTSNLAEVSSEQNPEQLSVTNNLRCHESENPVPNRDHMANPYAEKHLFQLNQNPYAEKHLFHVPIRKKLEQELNYENPMLSSWSPFSGCVGPIASNIR